MTSVPSESGPLAQPAALPVVQAPSDLVTRRQAMRMGVGDVAQRLKLSPRQIEAIEAGDWAALPGAAFVRGALRGYGRLLNADVSALVDQVGSQAEPPLRTTTTLRQPMPRRGTFMPDAGPTRRARPLRWVVMAAIVLVALVLFFGQGRDLSQMRSWIGGPDEAATDSPQTLSVPTVRSSDAPGADRAAGGADASASPADSGATPPPLVPSAPVPAPTRSTPSTGATAR